MFVLCERRIVSTASYSRCRLDGVSMLVPVHHVRSRPPPEHADTPPSSHTRLKLQTPSQFCSVLRLACAATPRATAALLLITALFTREWTSRDYKRQTANSAFVSRQRRRASASAAAFVAAVAPVEDLHGSLQRLAPPSWSPWFLWMALCDQPATAPVPRLPALGNQAR